jgi:hypothetical protein
MHTMVENVLQTCTSTTIVVIKRRLNRLGVYNLRRNWDNVFNPARNFLSICLDPSESV